MKLKVVTQGMLKGGLTLRLTGTRMHGHSYTMGETDTVNESWCLLWLLLGG